MLFQSAIVTPSVIIVNIDNRVYNAQSDHPNFEKLRTAYKDDDVEGFVEAYDITKAVTTFVEDGVSKSTGIEIVGDEVLYKGKEVDNAIVVAIKQMMAEGFNIDPMIRFLENLMKNPSFRSVTELWQFVEAMGLTITEDGCFLAYKSVDENYMDKYSGTINNKPGSKPVRKDRNEVDDNPSRHCSEGYHVGALKYAGPGGWYNDRDDKVIICKINPADVVSVPNDHSHQKLRCCYYEPVGEFQGELKASVYSGAVGDDYSAETCCCSDTETISICVDDMLEGNCYICDYTNKLGVTKERYFLLEDFCDDLCIVELIDPEDNEGAFRSFNADRMKNIREWDGCYETISGCCDCDCEDKYW